ncbi:alpha-amylase, partial [Priestia megaterium]
HSILLSFIGVPAIYYHSLFGSQNDQLGVKTSGINRRINREKLKSDQLSHELKNSKRRNIIFSGMKAMISKRKELSAFSPYASQTVVELDNRVFAIRRINEETGQSILAVANVSCDTITLDVKGRDLFNNKNIETLYLSAYDYTWIEE